MGISQKPIIMPSGSEPENLIRLANEDLITKYMCMIGQLQWAVTLGRFDILAHVMSMSWFRLAPKIGYIERIK